MSKSPFNGAPQGPAPAQEGNKHVYDESRGGSSASKPVAKTQPIDTNDHGDSSEFARRHNARVKSTPNHVERQSGNIGSGE